MTDVEATFVDFIASQRSGRRNAVHEISSAPDVQGPTDLAQGLAKLSINKSGDGEEDGKKKKDSAAEEEATQAVGS